MFLDELLFLLFLFLFIPAHSYSSFVIGNKWALVLVTTSRSVVIDCTHCGSCGNKKNISLLRCPALLAGWRIGRTGLGSMSGLQRLCSLARRHGSVRRFVVAPPSALQVVPEAQVGSVVPRESGTPGHKDWRMFFVRSDTGATVSVWHQLAHAPPGAAQLLRFVNEIPLGTTAKMELSKEEAFNPLKQDTTKTGELRHFKYKGGRIPFNYGFAPQTWETPAYNDVRTGLPGDGDPVDVVLLTAAPRPRGRIETVRVVGVLGLIDGGETDWKILAAPVATSEHEVAGLASHFDAVIDWFENYKTAEGKGKNRFAFQGVETAAYAMEVIHDTHLSWARQFGHLLEG